MINKYVIIHEGETEKEFFTQIKTIILKSQKIQKCKNHICKNIKGTIKEKLIIDTNNCCTSIYIIDKDKMENEKTIEYSKLINENNGILIISNPCLELILLSIFENSLSNKIFYEQKDVIDKLTKSLIKFKLINENEKYSKKNLEVLKKIINYLLKDEKMYINELKI